MITQAIAQTATSPDVQALSATFINTVLLMLIALLQMIAAYLALRTKQLAADTKGIALQTEVNTNSMKDALIKATGDASFAAGKEEARGTAELRAAALLEGQAKATKEAAEIAAAFPAGTVMVEKQPLSTSGQVGKKEGEQK